MKISEAFDRYRDDYIKAKNQSKRTEESHDYCKRSLIFYIGDISFKKLSHEHIRTWRHELSKGRASNTVRVYILRLRAVIRYFRSLDFKCIRLDLVPVPKREESTPTFLLAGEVNSMIQSACNLRAQFVVALLYSSGIRLSEMLSLNRDQIVDKRFTIIGKGGKERLCFIDDRTESLMNAYLASRKDRSRALVVSFEHKKRMTKTNVQLIIRNAAKAAGIEKRVTPHTMRHSFATNFLLNGGNIRHLSVLLGHRSIETTTIYQHFVDNEIEEAYKKCHTIA